MFSSICNLLVIQVLYHISMQTLEWNFHSYATINELNMVFVLCEQFYSEDWPSVCRFSETWFLKSVSLISPDYFGEYSAGDCIFFVALGTG